MKGEARSNCGRWLAGWLAGWSWGLSWVCVGAGLGLGLGLLSLGLCWCWLGVLSLALVSFFPTLAHAWPCTRSPTHPLTYSRAHAYHAHPLTHAFGRVARLHRRNPRARGTYIVVTHSLTHSTHTQISRSGKEGFW